MNPVAFGAHQLNSKFKQKTIPKSNCGYVLVLCTKILLRHYQKFEQIVAESKFFKALLRRKNYNYSKLCIFTLAKTVYFEVFTIKTIFSPSIYRHPIPRSQLTRSCVVC